MFRFEKKTLFSTYIFILKHSIYNLLDDLCVDKCNKDDHKNSHLIILILYYRHFKLNLDDF